MSDPTSEPRAGGSGSAARIPRFLAWLEGFAGALERGDLMALDGLFALGATYRPGPFAPLLQGRHAIREHLAAELTGRSSVAVQARALGVGATYAVAHWVEAWTDPTGDHVRDGIVLAAFDLRGRCTSLREWSAVGGPTPDSR